MKTIKLHTRGYLIQNWEDYGNKITKGFICDSVSAIVLNFFCQERVENYPSLANSNKGLLIMGAKGIGKTINFIVYRSIQAKLNGIGMRIINVKQLETQFKIQGEAYIQELIDCDELLLDDIGSEPRSIKDFGTDRNLVNDILIQRYNRFQRGGCITHATTNLNVQMLTEHYDTRLIDRMKEMFILKKITSETQSKRA
jgi:DNA replication protein DnaC